MRSGRKSVLVRHPDLDSRAPAGSRGHVHAAAGGLDTNTLRSQPDMSVGQPLGQLLEIETVAVVLDDERQLIVHPAQPDSDVRRLCVLDHIREELSGGREQKLLLRVTLRVSEIERQLQAPPARRLLCNRAKGAFEAHFFENVRMELEDGAAQLVDGVSEGCIRAAESWF